MSEFTPLSELGEFGLIKLIKDKIELRHPSTVKGIGDDAAVLEPQEKQIVVSSDMLLEGVHFDLTFCPLKHLGYKAVAVNVSDIAAMNAKPTQITVNIALGARFTVEAVDELYEGIRLACENYNVDLIGGDTTSSRAGLVISVTAIGEVAKGEAVLRSGAKENNLICVTGDLGAAYVGLQILEREKQAFIANPEMQPELEGKEYVVGRQLRPEARMDVIHELKERGIKPTAMIDVSDGLASELLHICSQSKVGATIYKDNLPADEQMLETAMEFNLDPITCIMNGGEDYELLFTVPLEDYDKVKNHPDISIIGKITDASEGVNLANKQGQAFPLQAQGWVHF
ncbi:thiamine-phosphate kinase [Pontibacter ummariensis]|uniref:Thiamine-monophosphate kinase n=1 Tax=Pontibacter ummariensis TaxID=1610492 RepID=A0A239J4V2_9BACT|nr:thiamine-phosphate kinase [Pontibacter ummariensis]PRY08883.1 thiamine-phosphate kinase [Pontibacter ummariensis]SNT00877.1 thiamine-phosphate kinase [Pontibacter ummariensis]